MSQPSRNTVLIVDNVDPDNELAAIVACHESLRLNLCAVIVTGRYASPSREANTQDFSLPYSEAVRQFNTRRMKGLLTRLGYSQVPVYEGLIPSATLVPHSVHIDEALLDFYGDHRNTQADGSFDAALDCIASLRWPVDIIVGGPLTEVAALMRDPRLSGSLGTLTCQLGAFGFGDVQLMGGGRKQFNAACDPAATHEVLNAYPAAVYLVPTDVTKRPEVGFDSPKSLRALGLPDEIVRQYEIFYREVLQPRNERVYPHDVHPVLLMAQLRRHLRPFYGLEAFQFEGASEEGEISIARGRPEEGAPQRYLARTVDAVAFREHLKSTT